MVPGTWAPATTMLPLPLALLALPLCRIVAQIVAAWPTARKLFSISRAVWGLQICGYFRPPSPIVRIRAQRLRLPRSLPQRIVCRGAHASPFSEPSGFEDFYGVGCQIRRQAGHGAAHSLATNLKAAEFIPLLAAVKAVTFFE